MGDQYYIPQSEVNILQAFCYSSQEHKLIHNIHAYTQVIQYSKNLYHRSIGYAHFLFRSLEDQHIRTRIAALCSVQYFLISLDSTDALSNQIFVKAVTSYIPDHPAVVGCCIYCQIPVRPLLQLQTAAYF